MDIKPSLRVTLDALARAGMPPGAALPAATPALGNPQPAGSAPMGALPSQAAAGNMVEIVAALNAAQGSKAGANSGGRPAAAGRPAARNRGVASPEELAALVNAEHGLQPGPNVPPALAAHFARFTQEAM